MASCRLRLANMSTSRTYRARHVPFFSSSFSSVSSSSAITLVDLVATINLRQIYVNPRPYGLDQCISRCVTTQAVARPARFRRRDGPWRECHMIGLTISVYQQNKEKPRWVIKKYTGAKKVDIPRVIFAIYTTTNSVKRFRQKKEYFGWLHETDTTVFTILSAIRQAKVHLSSTIISKSCLIWLCSIFQLMQCESAEK